MKVNLEYLEGKLESLDGDELMKVKDNINSLFQHCIQALGEEHQIKVVNALQTLCALFRGVHQKNKSTSGFDIINMLMGFDKAELRMKVTDNISQNTILEYVMINSIFEAILQSVNPYIVKLSIVDDETTLNGKGLVISQALSEYNRQYKDKEEENQGGFFSALTTMVGSMFIADAEEKISVQQYKDKEEENQGGFFSALTTMVGSMFIADAEEKISVQTNEAILLALYEAVHLNRNFITVLAQEPVTQAFPSVSVMSSTELPLDPNLQTSNLLITFLKYSSIVMQDTKDEHRLNSAKLCLIILTCIAEDQYANAFLHDDNMNFRVNLHRMPMRHRKKGADKNIPSRPLVVHKLICYQKKCRVRLHYTWRELWSALINLVKFLMSNETVLLTKYNIFHLALLVINLFNMFITYGDTFLPTPSSYDELYYEIVRMHQVFDNLYCMVLRLSTNAGQWKEAASKVTLALVNIRAALNSAPINTDGVQVLEVVRSNYDTLTLKLQDGLDQYERYSEQPKEAAFFKELVLEVVRSNYDTLTLKLQDGLDQYERYSEQPKEAAFFKELVRSISLNVRKNVSLNTLSQDVLLKEFSSIS
ncbi:UNVERIFIED_CONTAM: hypothetical protein FKN15_009691 [Acipenser sinensis]